MKLLLVNSKDSGGAAIACKRLYEGLKDKNMDVNILLRIKQNNWSNSHQFKTTTNSITMVRIKSLVKRILGKSGLYKAVINKQLIINRDKRLEMFSFPESNYDITLSKQYQQADIINLHWVPKFLDTASFFKKVKKPVVWTLHDMNPFSGGEHFEELYLGIDDAGFPVNRVRTDNEIKVSREILEFKKKLFSSVNNLTIVAPSKWLKEKARESEVFKNMNIVHIPNGLDSKIFAPRDKDYSRNLFNIPKGKKVLLFVADSLNNNRKGFVFLKKAFEKMDNKNLVLCAIGNKNKSLESINNIIELGPIHDERLMSIAYSAADVFVIPSLMDNLPNTVLESIMCGTPVIGFPIGGIPDMIQDGENGYLTEEVSVSALVDTITKFIKFSEKFNKGKIRKNAVEKYSLNVQAKAYSELFNSLIN